MSYPVSRLFLQKELIRQMEMGPFKHTVDDGLDIRKVHCHVIDTIVVVIINLNTSPVDSKRKQSQIGHFENDLNRRKSTGKSTAAGSVS